MSELATKTSQNEIREKIANLEAEIMKMPNKIHIEPKHYFSNGVYAREIFIPKGAIVIGKIHKFENLNIMSKGKGQMFSIDGAKLLEAPYTVVSSPGVKRAYLALEDTVWTTILGTRETNPEKIEELFIAKTYDDVVMIKADDVKKLEGVKACLL